MADSSHRISLEQAIELTKCYRESAASPLGPWALDAGDDIRELLGQPGVTGIRIYMGTKSDGSVTPLMVGTDAKGSDLSGGIILEEMKPCPPLCDERSPLGRQGEA